MNIGILGHSLSGKSTLLSAFSGGKGGEGKSTVFIPDERLDVLADFYKTKKKVQVKVFFEELPALDASSKDKRVKLEEMLRRMDAFVFVVGGYLYDDEEDILAEMEKLKFDIIMMDLDFVVRRKERLEKQMRLVSKDRDKKEKEKALLEKLEKTLESERFLHSLSFNSMETEFMANYNLVTYRSGIFVLNVSENVDMKSLEERAKERIKKVGNLLEAFCINAKLEEEVASMGEDEIEDFMREFGIEKMGRERILSSLFHLLDYITFYTASSKECRAWIIPKDKSVVEAAGKIHTDLARGFIKAEVIPFHQLVNLSSEHEAKEKGLMRMEGREYIVKDGDVLHIMFNV